MEANKPLKPSAQKVQDAVIAQGFEFTIVEFSKSTRTAAEAATAIGCTVSQIAKSLVFKGIQSQTAILVIASGTNRVDEEKVAAMIGEKIERAGAEFVREQTGFVIGGVPPAGHDIQLTTLIDEDLFLYNDIWAAAGTPNAVFKLTPQGLAELTKGLVTNIKQT